MRTIRNFTLCILHFAFVFAAALSGFAKTFDVDISTGRPAASNEAYYHGETIEFRAVRGRSVVTNVEYASIYYQTNGMGDVWWRTDGLTFHPTNDVGAASYRFFMEGRDDLGRDWHANGLLRLLPSPGFTPNEITMPVATLDFSGIEVLNPPYYDKAETEAKIVELAPAPGDYAAVSNAAVHAAITNALQDTAIAGKADREIVIGQMKGLPGDCFPIAYVYNGDSYSIVNSGGIVVDQFGPAYYRLADSVTGVAVCYFRISDGTYISNGEASGITFGGTAPTQLAWPVLGDVPKKSPVVYDVDIKTNYYTKADTEAKIVELAPAPGDYSVVSNRAMTAVQSANKTETFIFTDKMPGFVSVMCVLQTENTFSMFIDGINRGVFDVGGPIGIWSDYYQDGPDTEWKNLINSVVFVVDGQYDIIAEAREFMHGEILNTTVTCTTQTRTTYDTATAPYALNLRKDSPILSQLDAATATNAQQAAAIAGKQDNLPYPTNAIPYAAISGKPSLATVATSGSYNDLSNKPTIPTVPTNVSSFNNDAGYLTGYTESDPTIKSWAKANTKPTYTASEVGAATAEDVYRIVAGTNVILVVTNYNSAVHAPAMKLQHLDPESGQYVTYWDEQRRHGMTLTNAMDYTDAAAAAELSRADAAYAPRAWSGTTSALGAEAPAGVTWISTPETVIAGGYEYEKVITTAGAVWVLTSNGLSTGATTNSYFRVSDSDGTELFSIEKTDSYLVGVNATGITKSGNTVTIPVNVVAPSHPYIRATTNLVNAVWTKEDENGFTCPFASVSWSGSSGAYVATVTCSQPQAFFYFEFMQQGTAKIKNSAKTEMTGGIIFNGTTYMPTVNGNKLEFVAQ